jgi:alpha-glucoside transport system substrate-binding protein
MSQRRWIAPIAVMGVAASRSRAAPRGSAAATAAARRRPDRSHLGRYHRIRGGSAPAVFDEFTKDTGIKVEYTGDKSFEGNIVTKVTGGDAPDIAIVRSRVC